MLKVCSTLLLSFLMVHTLFVPTAYAQRVTLLIDAEVDDYLNSLAAPLLKAADLNPENVQVHLIQDNTINAFVNSQRDIYVNSGLILKAETENEVIGVLAHEIGHIKGHHLLRIHSAQNDALLPTLLSGIVGIGIAVAGAPDAGVAVLAGGQAAGIASLLKFSRSQEQQADQIGVSLLQATENSNQGLKDFFGRLRTNELLYHKTPPAYLITHPRSADREGFLDRVKSAPHTPSKVEKDRFARIQAKVAVLSIPVAQARRQYMNTNDGPANYVRAIAYALEGQYSDALPLLEKAEQQLDDTAKPYIYELRGQIAFDTGAPEKARNSFAHALELVPYSPVLRFHYARALTETKEYEESITQYNRVIRRRPTWWLAHYHQGVAYGRSGQKGLSHLAFAESNLYRFNVDDGLFHAQVAEKFLKEEHEQNHKDNTLVLQKVAQVKLELEKLGK